MCGIAGCYCPGMAREDLRTVLERMAASLTHRGPDAGGVWQEEDLPLGMAHRRLSIIDLSPSGAQPMASPTGRYVMTYNGEVYNYRTIRKLLANEPIRWRGRSDTEVMLAAIDTWGIERAITKFVGMFAFALWDRRNRSLTLARDRLGIKPLYYRFENDRLVFASEIKALRQSQGFQFDIDRQSIGLFLKHNYIPAPHSIYRHTVKLLPGHFVTFQLDFGDRLRKTDERAYWNLNDAARKGAAQPFLGTAVEARQSLFGLLQDAVDARMISDVPLGAFLSGGIDSSLVVALMQSVSPQPVKTFTIGFKDDDFNEAHTARRVAAHLGTEHTELILSPDHCLDLIPSLPAMFDEPFSDPSQMPTYMVSRLARESVTVCLSGDGGDELFGGYERYQRAMALWDSVKRVPAGIRRGAAGVASLFETRGADRAFKLLRAAAPFSALKRLSSDRAAKLLTTVGSPTPLDFYRNLNTHWLHSEHVVLGCSRVPETRNGNSMDTATIGMLHQMMLCDSTSYLPDDILVKLDRTSMAVGLEARVPMLDHRVVEFAWTLPPELKTHSGEGKTILRDLLRQFLPTSITRLPKKGFGVPIGSWLRGPLRQWAGDLLNEETLRRDGIFRVDRVSDKWRTHLNGEFDWQYYLWDILMFQAWYHESL
jgi:asparagine synthase (glutamine-hydrolysing)